ncbi:hypothetical protein ACHAPY_011511 [Fusarium culmorum]
MQISIIAILGLAATTSFAMPAPEAEGGVLEARATPYLRFYNKINFKQPLCNFEFTNAANQDGTCIRTPSCARNTANSVRLQNGVASTI